MQGRVFVIHRLFGSPDADWYPWLKAELERRGFVATVPQMPNPRSPRVGEWLATIADIVGTPDDRTYLVGHSLGCQAIMRYLESLPAGASVGGAVLVAPFFNPKPPKEPTAEDKAATAQWLTPIDYAGVVAHSKRITAIFSKTDPYVPLTDVQIFEDMLHARTVVLDHGGHFTWSDGATELEAALDELLSIAARS